MHVPNSSIPNMLLIAWERNLVLLGFFSISIFHYSFQGPSGVLTYFWRAFLLQVLIICINILLLFFNEYTGPY